MRVRRENSFPWIVPRSVYRQNLSDFGQFCQIPNTQLGTYQLAARVLVRLDHVASLIVDADHGMM
jgi:hypothetical protein